MGIFKLALLSALVFFEHGTEMQLATALVINVVQLAVHVEVKPMGGEDASMLNALITLTLVLTTYINFGALVIKFIEVSKELTSFKEPELLDNADYDQPISVLSSLMTILCFLLFFTFGAYAFLRIRRRILIRFGGKKVDSTTTMHHNRNQRPKLVSPRSRDAVVSFISPSVLADPLHAFAALSPKSQEQGKCKSLAQDDEQHQHVVVELELAPRTRDRLRGWRTNSSDIL